MVSRSNWMNRERFMSRRNVEGNPSGDPGQMPRVTMGGLSGPRQMPAGPAGAAMGERRGGMGNIMTDAVERVRAAQDARAEMQSPAQLRPQRPVMREPMGRRKPMARNRSIF